MLLSNTDYCFFHMTSKIVAKHQLEWRSMADPSLAGPRDHDMKLEPTFRKWHGRLTFSRATKCYMPHQAGRLQTGVYALILPQRAWQPSCFVSMTGRRGSHSAPARSMVTLRAAGPGRQREIILRLH